jgi:hypothetical protein
LTSIRSGKHGALHSIPILGFDQGGKSASSQGAGTPVIAISILDEAQPVAKMRHSGVDGVSKTTSAKRIG